MKEGLLLQNHVEGINNVRIKLDPLIESAYQSEDEDGQKINIKEKELPMAPNISQLSLAEYPIFSDHSSDMDTQSFTSSSSTESDSGPVIASDQLMNSVQIGQHQILSLNKASHLDVIKRCAEMGKARKYTMHEIEQIFYFYCSELNITPVSILSYYQKNVLKLHRYKISDKLLIAISAVIPLLTDMERIDFIENYINDTKTDIFLEAIFTLPNFKTLKYSKNEI